MSFIDPGEIDTGPSTERDLSNRRRLVGCLSVFIETKSKLGHAAPFKIKIQNISKLLKVKHITSSPTKK